MHNDEPRRYKGTRRAGGRRPAGYDGSDGRRAGRRDAHDDVGDDDAYGHDEYGYDEYGYDEYDVNASSGRFIGLTALSTVLPGAGLLPTRRRPFGLLLLLGALLLGSLVLFYAWRKGFVVAALDLAVRPRMLVMLVVGTVLVALLWCAGIVLTARETAPSGLRGRGLRHGFAALCCLLVIAPAAVATRYLTIQHDVITVLTGDSSDADEATANAWADKPRVNVLLLGSDAGDDRVGVRTDSMMVASIDTATGDAVLFGLPRNLEHAPFPESNPLSTLYPNGYDCGDECLLNGVWTLAVDHAEADPTLFPGDDNPGLTTDRKSVV